MKKYNNEMKKRAKLIAQTILLVIFVLTVLLLFSS